MRLHRGDPVTIEPAWTNRRILAERLDWPAGALDACERIEPEHPGWSIFYCGPNTVPGFEKPAGFWATRRGLHACEVFAADPDELVRAIEDAPPAEHNFGIEGCAVCCAAAEDRLRRAGL